MLELVDAFLTSHHENVRKLQDAVDLMKTDKMAGIAHAIKGSSLNLGVFALADKSRELETACRSGDLSDVEIAAMIADLKQIGERVDVLLKSYVKLLSESS